MPRLNGYRDRDEITHDDDSWQRRRDGIAALLRVTTWPCAITSSWRVTNGSVSLFKPRGMTIAFTPVAYIGYGPSAPLGHVTRISLPAEPEMAPTNLPVARVVRWNGKR
jgi:hypothetical protein